MISNRKQVQLLPGGISKKWGGFVLLVFTLAFIATSALVTLPQHFSVHAASTKNALTGSDWSMYMGDIGRSGFNANETTINQQTAPNLKLKWKHLAGGRVTTQPIEANGMVYWGSWDGLEHATNPSTGTDIWTANLGQTLQTCSKLLNGVLSSAEFAHVTIAGVDTPVLFVGGGNVQVYALNANTGTVIWQTPLGTQPTYFLYGSPALYNGSVYIGISSHDDCPLVRAGFAQLNATTGVIQNTFYTVPSGCTGASVWTAPAIDTTTQQIYFATGNPGKCTSTETMGESLIEVNASDLSFVASWQVPVSQQATDSDFGSTPTLFTATIGGVVHQMIGLLNKNGIYYAFDRTNIGAGPLWQVQLAAPTVGVESDIASSAWDGTNLYEAAAQTTIAGVSCKGSLRALNPATGAFIWERCLTTPAVGPVSMVAGLAEVGVRNSIFIVNAQTGKQLFQFHDFTKQSGFSGPGSFANGMLYHGDIDGYLYAFGL